MKSTYKLKKIKIISYVAKTRAKIFRKFLPQL